MSLLQNGQSVMRCVGWSNLKSRHKEEESDPTMNGGSAKDLCRACWHDYRSKSTNGTTFENPRQMLVAVSIVKNNDPSSREELS